MRHITLSHDARDAEAIAFWVFGGIIMLIAFGEALAVLAGTVALVAAVSWIYHKVERRAERHDVGLAPVTRFRRELTAQRDPKMTSADPSHRGPRAA
jgi:hypothetical protein